MNNNIRLIFKYIFYPFVLIRRVFLRNYKKFLEEHDLKKLAGIIYRQNFGRRLDWNNPQNLSEKINWMKFNSDTSLWSKLADKYAVREFVKEKGLDEILVQLYGVWEKAEDIDFDSLPRSFVLKTNHSCGTVLLVENKDTLNIPETRRKLNEWLTIKIGKATAEPHYLNIKPLIIAEEFLQPSSGNLIDYKLYVVHGNTELVMVCSERKIGIGAQISLYDTDWQFCPERLGSCHSNDCVPPIEKPITFEKMKEFANVLCKDFPFVRMDFYEVEGKIYFGEMTFTPKGGYCSTLTDNEQLRIGQKIILPKPII